MYAHCLFCNAHLGTNEALEAFPAGRRLAYDAAKGRLWVVCPACARWNLTPLEERWEAIEQAERLYRGTRLRASTDNVGLARVADGADLVRIGAPLRPELAAWRYAAEYRRRRAVSQTRNVAGWLVVAGGFAALASGFGAFIAVSALQERFSEFLRGESPEPAVRPIHTRIRVANVLVSIDVAPADARVVVEPDGAVAAVIPYGRGTRRLASGEGLRVLGGLMRNVNVAGAPATQVDLAVERLARAPDLEQYLRDVQRRTSPDADRPAERRANGTVLPRTGLMALTALDRLALEMALHEESERRALDGELAALEAAWRDAEEIAAIADDLVLPRGVQDAWERLRTRVRS